jgi:hypothetical protein
MAFLGEFSSVPSSASSLHKPVLCGWRMFDVEGKRILQLDTYGSEDRQIPDKVSQSIQIDREGAATLLKLIREAFPGV